MTQQSQPPWVRGSNEPIEFWIKDRDGASLATDTVTFALVPDGTDPDDSTTWLPCTYVAGTRWRTTAAVDLSADNYPLPYYRALANDGGALADLGTFPIT
jgi:hypothetical protein